MGRFGLIHADDLDKMQGPKRHKRERLASTIENGPLVQSSYDPDTYWSVEEAIERFDLSPIVQRFGTWAVTSYGVECLAARYYIEKDRLWEDEDIRHGWLDHMCEKPWVVLGDFAAALEYGRKYHKMRSAGLTGRFRVFQRDGYRCQICGRSAQDGATLEVDHKVPRSKGGSNDIDNLWTLCFECNRGKHAHDL